MAAMLQHKRINDDCERQREDQRAGDPVWIGSDTVAKLDYGSDTREYVSPRCRLAAARLRNDEIMIAAGESFTQFSSPSFRH